MKAKSPRSHPEARGPIGRPIFGREWRAPTCRRR